MEATLIQKYNGYSDIRLLKKNQYKWEVEIIGSGKVIEVYEDEFLLK